MKTRMSNDEMRRALMYAIGGTTEETPEGPIFKHPQWRESRKFEARADTDSLTVEWLLAAFQDACWLHEDDGESALPVAMESIRLRRVLEVWECETFIMQPAVGRVVYGLVAPNRQIMRHTISCLDLQHAWEKEKLQGLQRACAVLLHNLYMELRA